jgi:hypothetical protein
VIGFLFFLSAKTTALAVDEAAKKNSPKAEPEDIAGLPAVVH